MRSASRVSRPIARLIAVLMLLGSCSEDVAPKGSGDGAPAHDEAAGSLVYLFPNHVPEGMELDELRSTQVPRRRREPASFAALVGTKQSDGAFTDNVHVIVTEAQRDREISADERETYEIVDINGVPARFRDHQLTGAILDWFASGLRIGVIGASDSRRDVLAVARALRLPRSGKATAVTVGSLPAGRTLIAERGIPRYRSASYSFGSHTAEGGTVRSFTVSISTFPDVAILPVLLASESDHLRYVDLRDADAAISLSTKAITGPSGSIEIESRSIAWLEYPDVLVTIISSGLTEQDLIEIAEGLEEMSESAWRDRFPR